LRFERSGYRTVEQSLELLPGDSTRVDCRLTPDPALAQAEGALLDVQSKPPALAYVDGKPYQGERLPHGPHIVRLERGGFHPWTQSISLEPRARRQLMVSLRPTREHLAEVEAARHQRNVLAAGIGVASVVVESTAAVLYAWNTTRYDDFTADREAARRELARELASGGASSSSVQTLDDLTQRAVSIERVDGLALGLGLAGLAGLTSAGIVWLTGDH